MSIALSAQISTDKINAAAILQNNANQFAEF
jgi:hypothetical protein